MEYPYTQSVQTSTLPQPTPMHLVVEDAVGLDESRYLLQQLDSGANLHCVTRTRLLPVAGFDMLTWMKNFNGRRFIFAQDRGFAYHTYWVKTGHTSQSLMVRIDARLERNSLKYCVHGPEEGIHLFEAWMDSLEFRAEEVMVNWCFGKDYSQMDSYRLPLQLPKQLKTAFPWIPGNISDYARVYKASSSSILFLVGPAGTGKTSCIKELIREMDTEATVTYDMGLLAQDGFFAQFMADSRSNLLVLEDADAFLSTRKEGNDIMHRFLNAADGLVSLSQKKIIFTTNLRVGEIDSALLRPGRCHEVLHSRALTRFEARAVLEEMGAVREIEKDFITLAELTNRPDVNHEMPKKTLGFV